MPLEVGSELIVKTLPSKNPISRVIAYAPDNRVILLDCFDQTLLDLKPGMIVRIKIKKAKETYYVARVEEIVREVTYRGYRVVGRIARLEDKLCILLPENILPEEVEDLVDSDVEVFFEPLEEEEDKETIEHKKDQEYYQYSTASSFSIVDYY